MLEAFIKFADRHARVVVVGLVATIIVGSVGGGFWIHTLQSILDEKDKIQEQKIAIVEGRLNNRLALISQENAVLLGQLKIMEGTSIESSRSLKQIVVMLESKRESRLSLPQQQNLETTIRLIQSQAEMFEKTVERVRDLRSVTLGPTDFMLNSQVETERPALSIRLLPIVLIAAFIFLTALCIYQYRKIGDQQTALLKLRDHLDEEHLARLDADTLEAIQWEPSRTSNDIFRDGS